MSWDHTKPEFIEEFRELLDEEGLTRALEWAWSAYEYALQEGTESHAAIAKAAYEMRKAMLPHEEWPEELKEALLVYDKVRCCSRDHDRDGNCDRHVAPGVVRLPLKRSQRS